jgi:hypothetical protein
MKCISCALILFASSTQAQTQDSYGKADDPVVAEVRGMQIRTSNAEEMVWVIKQKLFENYVQQHDLEATDAEIREYNAKIDGFIQQDLEKQELRRSEILKALKSDSLAASDRKQLNSELKTLNDWKKSSESALTGKMIPEEEAAKEMVAKGFIEQWKVSRALYQQFGGRVIYQQGGAEPLDAYRKFYEDAQSKGEFKIIEKRFEPAFWDYYTTDSKHSFYPENGDEKDKAINTHW